MTAKALLKIAGGVIAVLLSISGYLLVDDRTDVFAQIKTVDESAKKADTKAEAAMDSVKAVRADIEKKQIRDSAWQARQSEINYGIERQMVEIATAVKAPIVITPRKPDTAAVDSGPRVGP